ncbi:MAG: TIGR02301 family protein [Pseudomonadota bacterium]|nr:TIGR02301 family protein [Pseudomonadota bacterium]
MHQQFSHRRTLQAAILGLCLFLPALSAQSQSTARSQDYYRDVTALAEVLGKAHAVRVACNGRNDQYWRSYMLRLLELEAPYQGGLRRSMVNGFNAGFSWGNDLHRVCDGAAANAEKAYAAEGRDISARLVQANIPGASTAPLRER